MAEFSYGVILSVLSFLFTGVFFASSPSKGLVTVSESSQLVRNQAAAGQRKALLSPADGEQQGQVKAQEEQGQAEAHAVSRSSG